MIYSLPKYANNTDFDELHSANKYTNNTAI